VGGDAHSTAVWTGEVEKGLHSLRLIGVTSGEGKPPLVGNAMGRFLNGKGDRDGGTSRRQTQAGKSGV